MTRFSPRITSAIGTHPAPAEDTEGPELFDLASITPDGDTFDRNTGRKGSKDCDDNCSVCGRPIVSERAFWVECVSGGMVCYPQDTDTPADENDASYMGLHTIGPVCKKKIPVRYICR